MNFSELTHRAQTVAQVIDHTLLHPQTTKQDIIDHCKVADSYKFFSVCVSPCFVRLAHQELLNSTVKICAVVGFPTGSHLSEVKAFETEQAVKMGADEIDMVIAQGALKENNLDYPVSDIKAVLTAAQGRPLKVILETFLLTDEEIKTACQCCLDAGAQFVKTSTGFSTGGATLKSVALMKSAVENNLGIKASGGIKNLDMAEQMLDAGATPLGTSSSVAIVTGLENKGSY